MSAAHALGTATGIPFLADAWQHGADALSTDRG